LGAGRNIFWFQAIHPQMELHFTNYFVGMELHSKEGFRRQWHFTTSSPPAHTSSGELWFFARRALDYARRLDYDFA
jgi:hypothetical protein